jgi:hypothetical protein
MAQRFSAIAAWNVCRFPIDMDVSFTLTQKIACLERELRLRSRVYPPRVASRLMSQSAADHEIALMQAILDDYRKQRDPE